MVLPRVLCVDDDPNLLDGLRRQLHGHFDVTVSESADEAFRRLAYEGPFAVVMSDISMPGLNGVEFLTKVRKAAPETTRVILTGYASLQYALAAINRGNVFRLLLKPCGLHDLLSSLREAAEQYRLINAEREFFDKTLKGSVKALCEALALANPQAFARASRLRQLVSDILGVVSVQDPWAVEVSATLSQIGAVVLPQRVVEKLYDGCELGPDEEDLVATLPLVAERVLSEIPRLDLVREIIRLQGADFAPDVPIGARVLRVALDLDALEAGGMSRANALQVLRSRQGAYDPALLTAMEGLPGVGGGSIELLAVPLKQLRPGMVIARDITDPSGRLLVGRGYVVTPSMIERVRNWERSVGLRGEIFVSA